MSRAVISRKGNLIFYIDDYLTGSNGYIIDYTKGDSSKNVSFQCKTKVIEYAILRNLKSIKEYRKSLFYKYPKKMYKSFLLKYLTHTIVVCVRCMSEWETDLLTPDQINHIILYEERDF